jgi:hypothetical protein
MGLDRERMLGWYPNLSDESFTVTSPATITYNCVAWAYGIDTVRMWPDQEDYWWPEDVLNQDSLEGFTALFSSIGYELCDDATLEAGYEKVAIYADSGEPTHVARQLPSGRWTSKVGDLVDIEHLWPGDLEGKRQGWVALVMRRTLRPEA